jgi:hypothetical protein
MKWNQRTHRWEWEHPPFMPKEKEEREGTFKPQPKHRALKAFGIIVVFIAIIILLRLFFNAM